MTVEDRPVLVEARDGKLLITLNRPDALNAHNQALRDALVEAIEQLESDAGLRVGILRGAGRAFSAGADLKEIASGFSSDRTWAHFERLWECDKPMIAAVHGHAAGGGCELALLCDVRVATADAKFSQPEIRSINQVAPIAAVHLDRFVGRGEAMMMHLAASRMSGERAYQVGLVQELVADQEALLPAAEAIADEIMQAPADALVRAKRRLRSDTPLRIRLDG